MVKLVAKLGAGLLLCGVGFIGEKLCYDTIIGAVEDKIDEKKKALEEEKENNK